VQPNDARLSDIGAVERPFFLSSGRIVLRRSGTWWVQATRLAVRQTSVTSGPSEAQPWSPSVGQTPEFVWAWDEGVFAPITNP